MPQIDIIVTMGGDGLIMNVANMVVAYEIPILRINFGYVGFLANIEPDQALDKILEVVERKNYIIIKKTRLEVLVGKRNEKDIDHNFLFIGSALNDVVIDRDDTKIITVTVKINRKARKNKFRCDALIFFTKTGSTAYNMSAGGRSIFKERYLGVKAVSPTAAATPDQLRFEDDTVFEAEVIGGKAIIITDGQKISEMDDKIAIIRKSKKYTYFIEIGDKPRLNA